MEMSKFRPESHVAQQSRRDKLRVQQSSNLVQHLEDFPNSLEQASSVQPGLNPDLVQVRNVRNANLLYDSTVISSGLTHLSTNSDALPPQRDAILHQELQTAQENQHMPAEESSFSRVSPSILSKLDASSKFSGDPQGCGNWKSVDSQHSCDWMVGYASGLAGRESNQNPMFFGEVLSNNARESNISAATQFLMPDYSAYQDVQPTLSNLGSEISPSLYHNALQDVVTTASQGLRVASLVHQNVREAARGSSIDYCGNQASPLKYDNAGAWMNRPLVVEHCQQWGGELGFLASKSSEELGAGASDAATQGLSLSLSSNPTPKISGAAQFTEDQCGSGDFNSPLDSKTLKPGHLCLMQKASVTSKGGGNTLQDTGGTSNCVHRQTGPLGPFTGYATILKNSRFLKPAQELLGEFCLMTNSKLVKVCDISEWISGEVSAFSADAANAVDMEAGANKGNNLEASASTFYSSNEIRVDVGVGSSSGEYCRPEYQQRKAKLLYLQEEVSNWFINARVRVWKPMVEEIHMLESKGLAEGNQNLSKSDGKSTSERGTSRPNEDLSINGSCINAMSDKQLASSDMLFTGIAGDAHDAEHWNHEKRSRMDFHIPTSMEGSLMCFAPYEQSRLELGGLGAVSLTLGLRQGVESAQQHQQQYQRQEDQLRRQFGGQMVQDFAG
ncbi:BEL1-like homeodomain protein 8 isoform X2 [Durio zibethinus]|uniref:BEL1-like homeodomain protein 8 isoform X2 n=1 Tax=Durio zibethinus TaxID=66656 RepID=A0A6P5XVK3_DURZI|nr:BEL1-like homeodomain protein 8 isoform X2 [Durio zibethinus]